MTDGEPDKGELAVRLPHELPVLTPTASRILLDILVELTDLEAPDGPPEEDT